MIEARALTKVYGGKAAVDGIDFRVKPGVVTGFLGPNGAGKSTTMRMIWHPIVTAHGNNWYAFIHVTTAGTAWLSAAFGRSTRHAPLVRRQSPIPGGIPATVAS
jgi:ABC-type branched-subunit amino acid transport system ATPase component